MARELIIVRRMGLWLTETITLPYWVEQYGIEPDKLDDGEVVIEITRRFKHEWWALKPKYGTQLLDLNCIRTFGDRLHDDEFADITVRMSADQQARTKVVLRSHPQY